MDRSGGEADLVTDAETGDAVEIQHGTGIRERDRSERQHVGTRARHEDTARAFAELQHAGGLGRARGVIADQAEETIVLEGHRASGDTAAGDVPGGVIEREFALIADEDAETTDGIESARAADDSGATIQAQITPEGVGGGEIERARATIIERATRGGAAVDDG